MKRKRFWIYLGLILFTIVLTYGAYFSETDIFQSVDDRIQDVKFRLRPPIKPSSRVVLVEIDGPSIDKFGRWPWKREIIADLITHIKDLGAKTIALDMLFSETTTPFQDKVLARAIKNSHNVVLGYFFRQKVRAQELEKAMEHLVDYSIEDVELAEKVKNVPLKDFKSAETNIDEIAYLGVGKGFFSVFPDRDGILRRLTLVAGFRGYLMPSLALEAISQYLDKKISLVLDRYGILSLKVGNKQIPVSSSGSIPLNFYGKGHTIHHISAVNILEGRVSPHSLSGKLVFVGVTEKAVGDLVPTPTDPNFPGTEVHCTFASNVLQNFYLKRDSRVYVIDILTILFVPIVVGIISVIAPNTFFSFMGFLIFGIIYFYFNLFAFVHFNLRLATIYPLFEFILSFILLEVYKNFVIEQKSRYLKRAFSSYISSDLVNELIKSPDKLKLGGEQKEISVLFLDIRDFTSISEKLTPEELVSLLNNFFGPLTDIILDNRGMLDKYVGDAMMALFNVPLSLKEHATAAVKSAVEIVEKVGSLNREFKEQGLPTLKIGIGINSGEAVVGNLGTKSRFDYTAIGDTVNLASRLEGLNKYLGTTILISEFTYKKLTHKRFITRMVGNIRVKGKEQPVTVYEVLVSETLSKENLELFEKGVQVFFGGEYIVAEEIFKSLWENTGDPVSGYYLNRLKDMKKQGYPSKGYNFIDFKTK